MNRVFPWVFMACAIAIAAGGYVQLHEVVFGCGLAEGRPQAIGIALIVLVQGFLYLLQAGGADRAGLYQVSQWALLPLLLYAILQLFGVRPYTALLFLGLCAIPVVWDLLRRHPGGQPASWPFACAFFVTCFLGFYGAIGEIPLLLQDTTIGYPYIAFSVAAAIGLSLTASWYLRGSGGFPRVPLWDFRAFLPFGALLLPVLRAKFPDVAYDSYMYKSTLPLQIAQWRTGDTAIVDGFMVGTNLQELLNALLILIAPDFSPSLISTVSYILLFLLIPLAFDPRRQGPGIGRAVIAFAGLMTFVLTEAGIAQGTSYQEPVMLLFLVAALIRLPAWPVFLALAIMVKINAAFVAPVIAIHHLAGYGRFWRDPRRLLAGGLAFSLALAPHLYRNVEFSGRVLGLNETLSAVTDPPGPGAILAPGETRYDGRPRGGVLNDAAMSACNMLALNGLCTVRYEGSENAGFHIFPASRSPLLGALFAVFVAGLALLHRQGRWVALGSAGAFFLSYAALLAFMSEGRYFLPVSFGFSVLLLLNVRQAELAVRSLGASVPARAAAAGLGCLLVGSNLLPGVLANVGWVCNRNLFRPPQEVDMRAPQNAMESFLAGQVDRYRQSCPPPGLPPVILSEHGVLNSPYLGTQRIFHVYTQQMIARFFAAEPSRQARAAEAIIAVVAQSPDYAPAILGSSAGNFEPCFAEGDTRAWCSRVLAPAGTSCARSLYPEP
jgi:hypothetical protein